MRPVSYPSPVSLLAAGLLALTISLPGNAQSPQGLDCGDRDPGHYAVVFDVSSSLRRNSAAARQTRQEYGQFITLLSGLLCRGESLSIYTFAPADSIRMEPVRTIGPDDRKQDEISSAIERALGRAAPHTDFGLALTGIRKDLLGKHALRAVFLVTDGSYYPVSPGDSDRNVPVLTARLTDLAALADTVLRGNAGFFVIGVGARKAPAIDPDLAPRWSANPAEQLWIHRPDTLNLKNATGDSLLRILFRGRYATADTLSLWPLLTGGPRAVWTQSFAYSNGWGEPLGKLENSVLRHILYRPPPSARGECEIGKPPLDSLGNAPQSAEIDVYGHVICSIGSPTHAQIAALVGAGVDSFSVRQAPLYTFSEAGPIWGLHDFALGRGQESCSRHILAGHFAAGAAWPLPGRPEADLIVVPVGSDDWSDRVPLVQYPGTHCLVPNFELNDVTRPAGDYLLVVRDRHGDWLLPIRMEPPRMLLDHAHFRPGGFPFPPDKLALAHICLSTSKPMRAGERVVVEVNNKTYHARTADGEAGCTRSDRAAGGVSLTRYALDGVVLLETTHLKFGRASIAEEHGDPTVAEDGEWLPISLEPDGRWFLTWSCSLGSFLIGVLIQFGYAASLVVRRRISLSGKSLTEMSLTILLSGVLLVVFTEFIVMIRATPLDDAAIPFRFALLVLVHSLSLIAAILLPERLREVLLSTGG